MIYAFTLVDDQERTQFGLVTAGSRCDAFSYIEDAFPNHTDLEIDSDIEALVNSQYSGIALLTTV
jgi:hypothetical protein